MSTVAEGPRPRPRLARQLGAVFLHSWWVRSWLIIGLLILGIALFGPFFSPYTPSELPGASYLTPSTEFYLGTDRLGRDVLSRVLWGGRSIIGLAIASTLAAYLIGGAIGLFAAYRKGWLDAILMRSIDVMLTVPALLFLLLLAYGAGPGPATIVAGVAVVQVPGIARLVRSAAVEISVRGYVEAAVARGERTASVLLREIVPNIATTLAADAGARFTGSFLLIASLNFLGLGLQPPAADWATMIAENRTAIRIQPWSVAAPAILAAAFTIAVNVVGDAFARSLGRSEEHES
jgi:ABC-type dipeptide/oligopeptide/nickel transport system permease subunit